MIGATMQAYGAEANFTTNFLHILHTFLCGNLPAMKTYKYNNSKLVSVTLSNQIFKLKFDN